MTVPGSQHIVVIGGGVAGLVAAAYLGRGGAPVKLTLVSTDLLDAGDKRH